MKTTNRTYASFAFNSRYLYLCSYCYDFLHICTIHYWLYEIKYNFFLVSKLNIIWLHGSRTIMSHEILIFFLKSTWNPHKTYRNLYCKAILFCYSSIIFSTRSNNQKGFVISTSRIYRVNGKNCVHVLFSFVCC